MSDVADVDPLMLERLLRYDAEHKCAQAGFGNNGTGIIVATGTYLGLRIANNNVPAAGNTTVINLGTVTVGVPTNFGITDNGGINPRRHRHAACCAGKCSCCHQHHGFSLPSVPQGRHHHRDQHQRRRHGHLGSTFSNRHVTDNLGSRRDSINDVHGGTDLGLDR